MFCPMLKYCVIINTYSRPEILVERAIESALRQSPKPSKVILVDQNTQGLTLSQKIEENQLFERQFVPVKAVSTARNSAQIPPEAEWIVFCDDDGYMANNYAKNLARIIASRSVKIIAGSILRDDKKGFYTPRHKRGGDLNQFRNTKLLMGSNFAVNAKTFKHLQGFDENFGAGAKWGSGEETDFAWKAYFNKIPMAYEPSLTIYHVKPYAGTWRHSLTKSFKYGIGKGALVAKWLVSEKKTVVLYEAIEMTLIPISKFVISVISLNLKNATIALSSLLGRYSGFILYFK